MQRQLGFGLFAFLILVQLSCSGKPPPLHNLSRDELVGMHDQYFKKMGLKEESQAEMRGVVGSFYDKITQQGKPLVRTKGHKFASKQDWLDSHQKYFQALGISQATQDDLRQAMAVLYDKMQNSPNEELVVAVQQMMKKFRGMPPCCSTDSLERAVK